MIASFRNPVRYIEWCWIAFTLEDQTSYAIIPSSYAAAVKAECGEVMEVTRFFDF